VRRERFPVLRDRTNLWPLLVTITARKALNQQRRSRAGKRGGGNQYGEPAATGDALPTDIEQMVGAEPTPAFAAEIAEECERRLSSLDDRLRPVAERKLQGYTNREIAEHLDVIVETVERRLKRIRELWSKWDDDVQQT
jgi:DNA-directed RNA polymerase specialized sigma24 family protein